MNMWILVIGAVAKKQKSITSNSKVAFSWVCSHSCASSAVNNSCHPNFRPASRAIPRVIKNLTLPQGYRSLHYGCYAIPSS